jgi:uncharacterized protein YhaN
MIKNNVSLKFLFSLINIFGFKKVKDFNNFNKEKINSFLLFIARFKSGKLSRRLR